MTNPRLIALRTEFIENRDGVKYLNDLSAVETRSLTPAETALVDGACTRMEAIETEIDETLARQARFDKLAAVESKIPASAETKTRTENVNPRSPVTFDPTLAGTSFEPRTSVLELGEYLKVSGRASLDLVKGVITRDGYDDIMGRVVAHGVAADGTAPVTIEGDLIKFVDANRYAVNASRQLPMPDNHAPTFKRPRTTQRTTVAIQTTEGDILSSQRLQNTGDTVTKATYGGVLALSEQEVDWTEPAMLGLAIQDLAQSYAIATDTVLTAAIEAAATANDSTETVVSLTAAASDFIAALSAAAVVEYQASKRMADTFFVSTTRWGYLTGLCDADGRPLFPITGPFNPAGRNDGGVSTFSGFNIMGLNVVVDPNFSTDFWCVARADLCETYEQNKGLLSINVPSTLETQYAYRGYFAANVIPQGIATFEAV